MRRVLVDLAGTGAPADTSAAPVGLRRLEGWLAAAAAQFDGDLAAYERFGTGLLAEAQARGDRFEAWRAAWGVGQARFLRGDTAAAVQVMDAAIDEVRAVGRLHAQLGFASQALLMRLALDADAPTLARLRELVPLLRGAGMLFEALGDALAWVPLHQGRLDDARRIQAWADARVGADKVVRSPVARRLRADFETRCGANPPPDGAQAVPDLDTVLRLVLAGPDGGTAPRT
jgi:hypothetical protein